MDDEYASADYTVQGGDASLDESTATAPPSAGSGVVSGSVSVDDPSAAPQALSAAVDATLAELMRELKRHADIVRAEGRGFADMVSGFVAAVDWRHEPWLIAVGALHLLAAILAVRHRRSPLVLSTLFAGGCAAVLLGERLNTLASKHWRLFATQDYFDSRGVFYSAVVGGPVLLNLVLVVAMYLLQCVALLAQAKGAQLKAAAARKRGGGGKAAAGGAGGVGSSKKGSGKGSAATPARRRAAAGAAAAETPRRRTRSQGAAL